MTVLTAIRDRFSGRNASTHSKSAGDLHQSDPRAEPRPPYPHYDKLSKRQLMDGLSDHSQIELEAAETYERSHKHREPVLTKLRYMQGREPLPGYDALSVEAIAAALEDADLATIRKVRAYERKFGNRPDVLEAVARVYHEWRARQPKSAAPSYQPLGGALDSSPPVDHPAESGSVMTAFPNLSAELTKSLGALWTRYAGERPTNVRTEIRGNIITCQLIDAVGNFNKTMIAPQTGDTLRGAGKPTLAQYKRDAVAAVVGLTRQRVTSFMSSHDRDTDVATEIFTLEQSLGKGRPRPLRGGTARAAPSET